MIKRKRRKKKQRPFRDHTDVRPLLGYHYYALTGTDGLIKKKIIIFSYLQDEEGHMFPLSFLGGLFGGSPCGGSPCGLCGLDQLGLCCLTPAVICIGLSLLPCLISSCAKRTTALDYRHLPVTYSQPVAIGQPTNRMN